MGPGGTRGGASTGCPETHGAWAPNGGWGGLLGGTEALGPRRNLAVGGGEWVKGQGSRGETGPQRRKLAGEELGRSADRADTLWERAVQTDRGTARGWRISAGLTLPPPLCRRRTGWSIPVVPPTQGQLQHNPDSGQKGKAPPGGGPAPVSPISPAGTPTQETGPPRRPPPRPPGLPDAWDTGAVQEHISQGHKQEVKS